MLSKKIAFGLLASVAILSAGAASAQTTGQGDMKVKVVAPLTITSTDALDFGTIYSPAGQSGQVTVYPADLNAAEVVGGVSWLDQTTVAPAAFEIDGNPNSNFNFIAPATGTVTSTAGDTINVGTFMSSCLSTGNIDGANSSGTLSAADGKDTCEVGATLQVPANVKPGDYTGTFVVEVAYQ